GTGERLSHPPPRRAPRPLILFPARRMPDGQVSGRDPFPFWRPCMLRLRAHGSARNRFLPGLEVLEDRSVPSTVSFNAATATLTVTGTAGKDAIVITDDGTNNAVAVKVTSNGHTLFTSGPTAGVDQVHTINVNTLGGNNDSVRYNLIGNMVANNRSVSAVF